MERILFDNGEHKFVLLGFQETKGEDDVPTNQYLISHKGKAIVLDPGGFGIYMVLFSRVMEYVENTDSLEGIFLSHQDPDVAGGTGSWLKVFHNAKVYMSHVWHRFMPHYNIDDTSCFVSIPDEGGVINLNGVELIVVPAYFNHSPGNLNLFDPVSGILFSGDIGAGATGCPHNDIWVTDWDKYSKCITPFHTRYMSSNKTLRLWINLVKELSPKIIAPQHGYLYKEEYIDYLLDYLVNLKAGADIAEEFYPKTLKNVKSRILNSDNLL